MKIKFWLNNRSGGGELDSKPVGFFSWHKSWNRRITSSELALNPLYPPLLPRLLAVLAVTLEVKWAAENAQFSSPKGVGPFLGLSWFVGVV